MEKGIKKTGETINKKICLPALRKKKFRSFLNVWFCFIQENSYKVSLVSCEKL